MALGKWLHISKPGARAGSFDHGLPLVTPLVPPIDARAVLNETGPFH